ncbi:hypothetical protein NPIL_278171 [Nephila pilipes]|uniref:Uncharacterized protein n=1 Tax=Nephila pilipes TaxID=299642 RepID=A0A8X6MSF9_NEPPI|nr:hypothetical protein NPIL_278171 [Nephila pilipes]
MLAKVEADITLNAEGRFMNQVMMMMMKFLERTPVAIKVHRKSPVYWQLAKDFLAASPSKATELIMASNVLSSPPSPQIPQSEKKLRVDRWLPTQHLVQPIQGHQRILNELLGKCAYSTSLPSSKKWSDKHTIFLPTHIGKYKCGHRLIMGKYPHFFHLFFPSDQMDFPCTRSESPLRVPDENYKSFSGAEKSGVSSFRQNGFYVKNVSVPTAPGQFRPISIGSILVRAFDKILANWLNKNFRRTLG